MGGKREGGKTRGGSQKDSRPRVKSSKGDAARSREKYKPPRPRSKKEK